MQIVSSGEKFAWNVKAYFLGEKKKRENKYLKLSSAAIFTQNPKLILIHLLFRNNKFLNKKTKICNRQHSNCFLNIS